MFPSWVPHGLFRLFRRSDAAHNDLRSLVENSRDVLCRLGPDLRIRYCSPSCETVLGWTPKALIGQLPSTFVMTEDRAVIADAVSRVERGEEPEPTTVRVLRPDGDMVWVETTTRTLRGADGRPTEFILVMRDVTERQALRLRLEQEAVTDPLTGLANRRAFDSAVEREWARAVRDETVARDWLTEVNRRFRTQFTSAERTVQNASGWYRSRFTGMTETGAQAACAALAERRVTCMVIRPQ